MKRCSKEILTSGHTTSCRAWDAERPPRLRGTTRRQKGQIFQSLGKDQIHYSTFRLSDSPRGWIPLTASAPVDFPHLCPLALPEQGLKLLQYPSTLPCVGIVKDVWLAKSPIP